MVELVCCLVDDTSTHRKIGYFRNVNVILIWKELGSQHTLIASGKSLL